LILVSENRQIGRIGKSKVDVHACWRGLITRLGR